MVTISASLVERWRVLRQEAMSDEHWVKFHRERDLRRVAVRDEILDLVRRYLDGEIDTEQLREVFDTKTRHVWDVFGFKGISGAMLLNVLVKHVKDERIIAPQLRAIMPVPTDVADGRERMEAYRCFVESLIASHTVTRQQLAPSRIPFFVSMWWTLQGPEQWPAYYVSARQALEEDVLFTPTAQPVDDYFAFRGAFLALAGALDVSCWELEHLLSWYTERSIAEPTIETPPTSTTAAAEQGQQTDAAAISETLPETAPTPTAHTRVQWLLAQMGKQLGCNVWIAANDQGRSHMGTRLGDMSVRSLPNLGLDPATQKIISLIDVLWIRGTHQVVAAFEVEHTTSIYSGLLRLSDLVATSPNLSFPLFIVTPEERIEQVRKELLRPTFQTLELNKRCGYFSEEMLHAEAESIMKWATNPSAIQKLASYVGDVSGEESGL